MKPLLALAALLVAAATLWYIRRPHDREYDWSEPDDGIQTFDPRTAATGLAQQPTVWPTVWPTDTTGNSVSWSGGDLSVRYS